MTHNKVAIISNIQEQVYAALKSEIIHGQLVIEKGKHTGSRAGRVLRHKPVQ